MLQRDLFARTFARRYRLQGSRSGDGHCRGVQRRHGDHTRRDAVVCGNPRKKQKANLNPIENPAQNVISRDKPTDEMCFGYYSDYVQDDEGNDTVTKRPRIEIVLRKHPDPANISTNPEFRAFGLVDSGADVSFIPKKIADMLCLELDESTIKEASSASGEFETYMAPYVHGDRLQEPWS